MAGGVSSSIQDSRRRVLVRRRTRILLRNDARLNCVSLRSRFDGVARRGLSRVEMNALRAPLTAPSAPREECFHFSIDNADVVIDEMLRQLTSNARYNRPEMTEGSQASSDQVLVECSSLPPLLRDHLQAFLERQPEVRAVTRRLHVSDALLNPDTVGLVAPLFDLVVHLAVRPQASAPEAADDRAAPILKKVTEWTNAHRPRESRLV